MDILIILLVLFYFMQVITVIFVMMADSDACQYKKLPTKKSVLLNMIPFYFTRIFVDAFRDLK